VSELQKFNDVNHLIKGNRAMHKRKRGKREGEIERNRHANFQLILMMKIKI
jgi:hypothetical protein